MREKKLPSQTLPDFQQYLLSRKLVPEKNVTFYAYWASRYLTFSKHLKNADAAEALRRFLEDLQSRENIVPSRTKLTSRCLIRYLQIEGVFFP